VEVDKSTGTQVRKCGKGNGVCRFLSAMVLHFDDKYISTFVVGLVTAES